MPSEVLRCSDCGAPLKAVPVWLASAHVNFTCNSCPRRSSRPAAARFDAPVETRPALIGGDPDLDIEAVPDLDEDADLDLSAEELDDVGDVKEPD